MQEEITICIRRAPAGNNALVHIKIVYLLHAFKVLTMLYKRLFSVSNYFKPANKVCCLWV